MQFEELTKNKDWRCLRGVIMQKKSTSTTQQTSVSLQTQGLGLGLGSRCGRRLEGDGAESWTWQGAPCPSHVATRKSSRNSKNKGDVLTKSVPGVQLQSLTGGAKVSWTSSNEALPTPLFRGAERGRREEVSLLCITCAEDKRDKLVAGGRRSVELYIPYILRMYSVD